MPVCVLPMTFVHQTMRDRRPINIILLLYPRMKRKGILSNMMIRRITMIRRTSVDIISSYRPFNVHRQRAHSIRCVFRILRRIQTFQRRFNVTRQSYKGFIEHRVQIYRRALRITRMSFKCFHRRFGKLLRLSATLGRIVRHFRQ